MKVLKWIGVTILTIIIFALILVNSISFSLKNVVHKELLSMTVKDVVTKEYVPENELTPEEQEIIDDIEKFINNKDVNDVVSIIADEFARSITEEKYEVKEESVDKLISICVKHKDLINEFSEKEITESEIRSPEVKETITKTFNDAFKDNSTEELRTIKFIIDSYRLFISSFFRLIIMFVIAIFILLIALIRWSYYKWLRPVGIALILSGIVMSAIYAIITYGISEFERTENINVSFSVFGICLVGIAEILLGILFIVLMNILNRHLKKVKEA